MTSTLFQNILPEDIPVMLKRLNAYTKSYQKRFESVNAHFFLFLVLEATFGRLAQLVQSICLTSRGSAVRIRQRPLFLRAIMIT